MQSPGRSHGLLVRDLGSRNGTWLGGCRIAEATLIQDVTLSFGQTSMAVRLADGALDLEIANRTEFGGALVDFRSGDILDEI